jgi:hypothetical protein
VADAGAAGTPAPSLEVDAGSLIARCGGGGALDVLSLEVDGAILAPSGVSARFGMARVRLGDAAA